MDQPDNLAETIAGLARDRASLLDASRNAAKFGRINNFDRTFTARIEHMKSCLEPSLAGQESA
jgi:hypothetical protein